MPWNIMRTESIVSALIGRTRGWLPETIDRWNASRPGRGVGGGRPRKKTKDGDH